MAIKSIITILVSVIIMILLYIKARSDNKINYVLKTSTPKVLNVFLLLFYILGCGLLILSIVYTFNPLKVSDSKLVYSIGLIFTIIGIICYMLSVCEYETLTEDKIIIYRFFRKLEFNYNQVNKIEQDRNAVHFYNEYDERIFSIANETKYLLEFIEEIVKKDYVEYVNITLNKKQVYIHRNQEDETKRAIYAKIGKEFKNNFPIYKKKKLIEYISIFILVCLPVLIFIIVEREFLLISILIIAIMVLFSSLSSFNNEYQGIYNLNEYEAGVQYYYSDLRVIGSNKRKVTTKIVLISIAFVLSLGFGSIFISLNSKPVQKDELISVTGTLEYGQDYNGRSNYFAIGIKETNIEYRSIYDKSFIFKFINLETVGNTVTIYVLPETNNATTNNKNGKIYWTNFYVLESPTEEYYSYDDYVEDKEENDSYMTKIGITFLIESIIAGLYLIITIIKYKQNLKKEYLTVFKSRKQ